MRFLRHLPMRKKGRNHLILRKHLEENPRETDFEIREKRTGVRDIWSTWEWIANLVQFQPWPGFGTSRVVFE